MFRVTLIAQDLQFEAKSYDDGRTYRCVITDIPTLESHELVLTPQDVADIVAFNMHRDGEPDGFEAMYARLEPKLTGLPCNLRPIP